MTELEQAMSVHRFRRRPDTVSALQWNGRNLAEVLAFCSGEISVAFAAVNGKVSLQVLETDVLGGDWITRSGDRVEVVPRELFESTYYRVE